MSAPDRSNPLQITDDDVWLFNEGAHVRLYDKLGAHALGDGRTSFAVWAPNAAAVAVLGDFNGWDGGRDRLDPVGSSGIWQGTVDGVGHGDCYKFRIESEIAGYTVEKADPFAVYAEQPPRTASRFWDLTHRWDDEAWMRDRAQHNALDAPMSIYEMHLGSWRHLADEHRSFNYAELAAELVPYLVERGFTHVEFLPLMEHPFYGSWGYQTTGFFAPTSRFGTPQELMGLIDVLHQHGIGVIFDWVPSHFPDDEHGLGYFDGTHLFEHADPRKGHHPDWDSLIFNYDRHEVRSFLLSSACSWFERYHIDGLRVDAVASMLYLDYSRAAGEWIPNEHGGNENLGALRFLKKLNEALYGGFPGIQTFAEESTAWPMVSRPVDVGGLGFGLKWDMGWMHDTLQYMQRPPVHRRYHQDELTFRAVYAFTENFTLPLSHDEVVHGKGSLLHKMPGDRWQQFANLRLLYGYQWTQPGKKLLFMGDEIAQPGEWDHDSPLQWDVLRHANHAGIQRWVSDLNRLLRAEPALHEADVDPAGFEWIAADDAEASVLAFLRWPAREDHGGFRTGGARELAVVCNFTPVPRDDYRLGLTRPGRWVELANSDAAAYGGGGVGNQGAVLAERVGWHGREWSAQLTLPPLAVVLLAPDEEIAPGQ